MRTVEEIKADMQKPCDYTDICELTAEFVLAVTADLHNDLDRLAEICAAEKDGRCVVLPCPFYSEVYALSQVGNEIIHGELRSTNKDYCLIVNLEGNLTSKGKTWQGVQVKMQDVFLTRAEADAALKGDAPNE